MNLKQKTSSSFSFNKIKGYFKSARLESAIASNGFLLIGLWISTKTIPLEISLIGFFSITLLVTAGSWQNYVFDIDVDKKAGKNIAFFNFISPKEMLVSSTIVAIIALFVLFSVDYFAFLLGVVEFIVFLLYSAPPVRFKNRVIFDFFANVLVFGTIPFLIGFRLSQTDIEFIDLLLSLVLGLLAGSYYLFISSFEIDTDKKANVKNTSTLLGFKNTINFAIIIFFISLIILLLFFNDINIILIGFIATTPVVIFTKLTKRIQLLLVLVSFMFLFWNGAIFFVLSLLTLSIIPMISFALILTIFIIAVYTYMVTEV